MEYIENVNEDNGCIFCIKPGEDNDRENLIVFRGKTCFVIMNRFPYNNGHLLIVPYKHTSTIQELDDEEKLELFQVIDKCCQVLKDVMNPQGFNIGMNLGRPAGAGIADHVHFHVVPRWNGDTNFMPVTGGTKIISEGLEKTWEKLYKAMNDK